MPCEFDRTATDERVVYRLDGKMKKQEKTQPASLRVNNEPLVIPPGHSIKVKYHIHLFIILKKRILALFARMKKKLWVFLSPKQPSCEYCQPFFENGSSLVY